MLPADCRQPVEVERQGATLNDGIVKMERQVSIRGETDIIAARQAAREMASALGFGPVDQSRITTAVSELARNVVRYATDGWGEVLIRQIPSSPRSWLGTKRGL